MSTLEAFVLGAQFALVLVAWLLDGEGPQDGDWHRHYSRLRLRIAE